MSDLAPTWSGEDTERMGMHLAWAAAESDIDRAMKLTHDALIAQMGANRAGGVQWRLFNAERGLVVLDECERLEAGGQTPPILPGVQAQMREEHAQLRRHLEESDGFLVCRGGGRARVTERYFPSAPAASTMFFTVWCDTAPASATSRNEQPSSDASRIALRCSDVAFARRAAACSTSLSAWRLPTSVFIDSGAAVIRSSPWLGAAVPLPDLVVDATSLDAVRRIEQQQRPRAEILDDTERRTLGRAERLKLVDRPEQDRSEVEGCTVAEDDVVLHALTVNCLDTVCQELLHTMLVAA